MTAFYHSISIDKSGASWIVFPVDNDDWISASRCAEDEAFDNHNAHHVFLATIPTLRRYAVDASFSESLRATMAGYLKALDETPLPVLP